MARRSRPRTSRASGKTYAIHYVDNNKLKHEDGTICMGLAEHQKMQLRIEDGNLPDVEADTLIHEMLHQLLFANGDPLDEETDELVAQTLGTALFAHIRENPEFWKYINRIAWPSRPRKRKPNGTPTPPTALDG